MKEIIAMHGWNGDGTIWAEWIQTFQKHGWIWQSCERGYRSLNSVNPQWHNKANQKTGLHIRQSVISHSLGIHLLNKQTLSKATHIVLLCGFGRFVPLCRESRAIKTALKGMKEAIGTNKENHMLNNFLEKAYYPNLLIAKDKISIDKKLTTVGRQKLLKDLEILINTNRLPDEFPNNAKVLVIEGEKDAILHKESSSLLIQSLNELLTYKPTHWTIAKGGHMLFSAGIKERILEWLE